MNWKKHRRGSDTYTVDFSERLDAGETLIGTPEIRVMRRDVDVTSEFVQGLPQAVGSDVRVRLRSAANGQQRAGVYVVKVVAETTQGDTVVETLFLEVSAAGSLDV